MEKWDIVCQQCGAHILTEEKDNCGEIHCVGGSYENGYYDEIKDIFYCKKCAKKMKF